MSEKLRNHISMLFDSAPKTKKAYEMKEELYANSLEKLQDLIAGGMNEEDAYKNVISSLGDVSILFASLENNDKSNYEGEETIRKRALINTIAIGIYFFAAVVFLSMGFLEDAVPGNFEWGALGFILAILICIVPTCMLVYVHNLRPKYTRGDNTVVEEFKEWQSEKNNTKEIRRAISSVIWTLTVILYIAISFLTYDWYITWVIFLVAVCVESIVSLLFSLKK